MARMPFGNDVAYRRGVATIMNRRVRLAITGLPVIVLETSVFVVDWLLRSGGYAPLLTNSQEQILGLGGLYVISAVLFANALYDYRLAHRVPPLQG